MKKRAFWGWGVGTLNSTQKPYMKTNLYIWGISLKQAFCSFLWHIGWKNPFISPWAMTDNAMLHGRKQSKNWNVNSESFYWNQLKGYRKSMLILEAGIVYLHCTWKVLGWYMNNLCTYYGFIIWVCRHHLVPSFGGWGNILLKKEIISCVKLHLNDII